MSQTFEPGKKNGASPENDRPPHDEKAKSASKPSAKAAARPKDAAPKAPEDSPQHHLAQMRHDPAAIRRVFETGEYPYAAHMRTGPYEEHMLKLQQE
ncbi:MAG: hypothetical protein ACLPG2_00020, partial [Rhodoblastus sp.]